MFLGHGLLAFALAAALARWAGWPVERAIAVGLLAGGFGLAPDVDMLYAPVGVLGAASLLGAADGFWTASTAVHRTVTHSVVVGAAAALAAGLWARATAPSRAAAVAIGGGSVAVAALGGPLDGLVMAAFAVAVLALAALGRHLGFAPATVGAAALLGLCTHPFGDLFTGEPPALLYPLDVTLVAERVVLHPDPTLHLLGALGLELATAWLAVGVLLWLLDRPLGEHVTPRAGLGVAFGSAAFVLPPPTLEASYHFVFPLLGTSVACALGLRPATWRALWARRRRHWLAAAVTGLAAVTLAAAAYALLYLRL